MEQGYEISERVSKMLTVVFVLPKKLEVVGVPRGGSILRRLFSRKTTVDVGWDRNVRLRHQTALICLVATTRGIFARFDDATGEGIVDDPSAGNGALAQGDVIGSRRSSSRRSRLSLEVTPAVAAVHYHQQSEESHCQAILRHGQE